MSDEEEEGAPIPSMASNKGTCFKKMILTRELSDLITIQRVKCMDFVLQHRKHHHLILYSQLLIFLLTIHLHLHFYPTLFLKF